MKKLFLVGSLFLLIGCKEKVSEKKADPISQQVAKLEEIRKMTEKKTESTLKQAAELEEVEKMPESSPKQVIKSEEIKEEKQELLSQQTTSTEIEWSLFEDGLKRAKAENKPLMVHFTADWCSWCKKLEAEAFKNQEVISLSKSFVPVKVDRDKENEIARKFQIRGLPTILFISPEGNVLHQVIGYRSADAFLSEMKTALSK